MSSLVFPTLPLPSPDGRLVAFSRPTWEDGPARRVYVASLRRKSLRPLTNGRRLDWPVQWSPEGRRLLVGHAAGVGHDNVSLVDVNGRTRRLVRVEGTAADGATWAPDGRRVLARLDVFGPRGLHLVNVRTWTSRRVTAEDEQPSWGAFTPTGRLAFITTRSGPVTQDLWLADEDGTNRELVLSTRGHVWGIQWSRDGSGLAVSILFGDDDTSRLVVLPATARKVEITETSGVAGRHAIWSPDGRRLAFVRGRFPTDDVWVMTADGGVERRLTRTRLGERPLAWLPARQS